MRKVKLYTLNEEDVWVTSDYVELLNFAPQELSHIRNSNKEFIVNNSVKVDRIPVEYLAKYTQGKAKEEILFAIDPKVKELLGVDRLKQDLNIETELKNTLFGKCLKLERETSEKDKDILHLQGVIKFYQSLSFWKRLVFLFTGVVK